MSDTHCLSIITYLTNEWIDWYIKEKKHYLSPPGKASQLKTLQEPLQPSFYSIAETEHRREPNNCAAEMKFGSEEEYINHMKETHLSRTLQFTIRVVEFTVGNLMASDLLEVLRRPFSSSRAGNAKASFTMDKWPLLPWFLVEFSI